jgi:tRNA uridine 5-carboxymethylaminomethyl modification enzyme
MYKCPFEFDVMVIGAGHAGCEAALASARLNAKTLLLTQDLDTIAQMSCNPSIGGIAKGQIVREIDALGGQMGINTDNSAIHYHMLNTGKGAAVHSPRAQCDKKLYHILMKNTLEHQKNLFIIQDEASRINVKNGKFYAIETIRDTQYRGKTLIITAGTFLNGIIHIGEKTFKGGRYNHVPSELLARNIRSLGFPSSRLKTGTPMRINGRSIDFSKCVKQPSDNPFKPFSHFEIDTDRPFQNCYITKTNKTTHRIILDNLKCSPLYSGKISSIGPRNCPSVEDKIVKFKDKPYHPVFLEPEGANTLEYYVNGLSTSLPEKIQQKIINSIEGLKNAEIIRPGYAIEYDYTDPTHLNPWLESKLVANVFFAGQVNGTTGYEEAAGQGLMAGINAVLKISQKEPFVLKRDEAYIGVLIDDLVTKGVNEPYRMFTSRAEYRLMLRTDNADMRLCDYGIKLGLVSKKHSKGFKAYKEYVAKLKTDSKTKDVFALSIFPWNIDNAKHHVEVEKKYEGYIVRHLREIQRLKKIDGIRFPKGFDVSKIVGISIESRYKLQKIKPTTLAQASRIPGISPSDISHLIITIEKFRKEKGKK